MTLAEFEKYAKEHNIFYCTKELQEPCDDVVSRQAVYEILEGNWNTDFLRAEVEKLPSVRPTCEEREKGECPWYSVSRMM